MNPYHLATWIAIPLLGLGGLAVFVMFLVSFFRHGRGWRSHGAPKAKSPAR